MVEKFNIPNSVKNKTTKFVQLLCITNKMCTSKYRWCNVFLFQICVNTQVFHTFRLFPIIQANWKAIPFSWSKYKGINKTTWNNLFPLMTKISYIIHIFCPNISRLWMKVHRKKMFITSFKYTKTSKNSEEAKGMSWREWAEIHFHTFY